MTENPRLETAQREGTTQTAGAKGKIIEFAWWLKKQGYRESTILGRTRLIATLAKRGADLSNPETIKDVIARQTWSEGRKDLAVDAYASFLKMTGGKWAPPRYNRIQKIPWISTESEVDQLIAATTHRIGTFLQLLKETGVRPGEAWRLKWIDLDSERRTVTVAPEKNSNPRIFKLSSQLIERIDKLPKDFDFWFGNGTLDHFARNFSLQRRRAAKKIGNPRINRISFKTLRHWKATMEYHRTRDILHVMNILGHKNIKNTLIYTHLVNVHDDEFVSKVAWNLEEACKLVEAGFEYVTEFEGAKVFKKRK